MTGEASGPARRDFVSVIVPARNAARTLPDCLLALRAQSYARDRYEVIVIDDGSTDATARIAVYYGARVVQIPPSGPAVARNRGVREARGNLVLFTDADCAPDPNWIRVLVDAFADCKVVGVKGSYRTEQKSWTARFVQAEYESRYRRMAAWDTVDFIDTYSAGYRREALEEVGGFDESFPFPSVEDQELSFRLQSRGARLVFRKAAVVRHHHASHPWAYFAKKLKIAFWKIRVLARYPHKAVRDSHTPTSLKAEIVLMGGLIVSIPLAVAFGLVWLPLVLLGLFLATASPFLWRVIRQDPALGLRAPLFLTLRSLALGAGMILGLFDWPLWRRRRAPSAQPSGQTSEEHAEVRDHA